MRPAMSSNLPFLGTQGIHNFRDYGGWPTRNGGSVRTGLLYRSGQHVGATDADLAAIAALDIRTIVDLRGTGERERNPCRRVEGWNGEIVSYDGETTSSPPHEDMGDDAPVADYARNRMLAVYTRMPHNPAMIDMFGRYLRILAQRGGASLVHCFAGKDRTGVAATLLLYILGVSEDDCRAEFLRTNEAQTLHVLRDQSLPGIEARIGRPLEPDTVRDLLEVRIEYLDTYLSEARRVAGSLDGYLERIIGVDKQLREALHAKFVT